MISSKRLLSMLRKWQKVAGLERRIRATRANDAANSDKYRPSVANRGHIFVYSADGNRFMIPLAFLSNSLLKELFRMSEEEFGLPADGPITLPCDASYMECIISTLRHGASIDFEKAVLGSSVGGQCSISSLPQRPHDQQRLTLYGF